jgi:serine/threonine protein kinase
MSLTHKYVEDSSVVSEYRASSRFIGKGTYGEVISVIRNRDGEELIAKISNISDRIPSLTRAFADNIRLEGRILEYIKAPYFVAIIPPQALEQGYSISPDQSILIMRSMDPKKEGNFLHQYLSPTGLKKRFRAHTCEIFLPIFQQLQNATEKKQIIHCDIKPENLLPGGIVDFGLAQSLDYKSLYSLGIKRPSFFGTPWYRGPEMWLRSFQKGLAATYHANLSETYDVWSLGATLFEMITLRPLFPVNDKIFNAPLVFYSLLLSNRLAIPRWMRLACENKFKGKITPDELLEEGWIDHEGYQVIQQFSLKKCCIADFIEEALLKKEEKIYINDLQVLYEFYEGDTEEPSYQSHLASLIREKIKNEQMAHRLGVCVASMLTVDPYARPRLDELHRGVIEILKCG